MSDLLPSFTDDKSGYVKTDTKYVYKWKVPNIHEHCKNMITGQCVQSERIRTPHRSHLYQWEFRLFPVGDSRSQKGEYMSLTFDNLDACDLEYQCNVIINDKQNNAVFESGPWRRKFSKDAYFRSQMIEFLQTLALGKNVLDNGTLTIIIEITIISESPNFPKIIPISKSVTSEVTIDSCKADVLKDLEKLSDDPKFYDVKLIVGDKVLHAHKNILATTSQVFAARFDNEVLENTENEVKITDVEYDVVKEMLRFIYCGKVEGIERIAADLLIAAEKYSLEKLKDFCSDHLCSTLSVGNVLEYYSIANMHQAERLKSKVRQFMCANAESIVTNPEFDKIKEVDKDLLAEIFKALVLKK